ncbi:MAG: hydantoinase/oxoprolinase family protein, partial [Rhodospirillaceae bacterium]|nr:hydantoinase/oxoprolinase family protein [Rhodospirillaceae bacterium]
EPSVPSDPSLAVERGIAGLLAKAGIAAADVDLVMHGTTLALNSILQRNGPRLGMVVSRGNRDVLEIARSRMPSAFDFSAKRETPLIPRNLVFEVGARCLSNGEVVDRPDEAALDALAARLKEADLKAVAVMLVNSFRHPELERLVADGLRARLPDLPVTESAAIWPEIREYERALLAALNAYVHPLLESYFERLTQRLAGLGIAAPLFVTTNNGGSVGLATARARPIDTLLSGPASGVGAALRVVAPERRQRLITLDMGGTSTDIAIVHNGAPEFTMAAKVGDYPLIMPVVGVTAIGAGGGSIVWHDAQGVLKIGPESAGAEPGPACYGLGGGRATITDCYLVTGILDPENFLGGRLVLKPAPAAAALERVAAGLRGAAADAPAAASAALQVATTMMAVEISKLLARRGYDHREFSLLAMGGAGATHANFLAAEAQLDAVVVPPAPGTFCALGAALADLRRDYARSLNQPLAGAAADFAPIAAALAEMEDEARRWIAGEGRLGGAPRIAVAAEMKYPSQAYELTVAVPDEQRAGLDAARLAALFHAEHERLYGFAERNLPVRVSTLRLSIAAPVATTGLPTVDAGEAPKPHGSRKTFLGGAWIDAALYRRRDLPAGSEIAGPAIVDQPDTTILILPGWNGVTEPSGNLVLTRRR